jgi:C1A family cysteine protease
MKYSWRPDLPDRRDYQFALTFPKQLLTATATSVDLRKQMSPVEDQGDLGSCTAQALVGSLEFLEGKNGLKKTNLSRLFVYYNERVIEGSVNEDSGAMIRDGVKTLAKQGVCTEVLCPYKISRFSKKPSNKSYTDGLSRKISSYHRLSTIKDMEQCLSSGYPFVFGFTVYESFEWDEVTNTGIVNMPKKYESVLGGHAVCAVGYDSVSQRFLVRNSWGTHWGQKGYFTMPYEYLASRNLSDDFWVINK